MCRYRFGSRGRGFHYLPRQAGRGASGPFEPVLILVALVIRSTVGNDHRPGLGLGALLWDPSGAGGGFRAETFLDGNQREADSSDARCLELD